MGRQQFSGNGKVWLGVCLCLCARGHAYPGTVMKVNGSCVLLYEIASGYLGSRDADVRSSLVLDFQYGGRIMFYVAYPLGKLLEMFQAAVVV